ncbi:MAG: 2'-5' RNA ligase family protein [Pseudomonadota bacterium]
MASDREVSSWLPWQRVFRHGTLVIHPPPEMGQTLDELRRKFDPVNHGYAQAHVTLTQPFRAVPTDANLSAVAAVIGEASAFEITLGPTGFFPDDHVLYLEVHPVDRVLALRGELHALGLFDLSLAHSENFVPHLTITERKSSSDIERELISRLGAHVPGDRFQCEAVTFICPNEAFRFEVVRKFALSTA